MPEKLHHTKGIVLRTVKYGETSVIVTVFTQLFGLQSYIINGIRTNSAKSGKASLFQPTAILDLIVYHNELKQIQRIREFKWEIIYQLVLSDVARNSISLYAIELLTKCLKQPEANPDLFYFMEDVLLHLDRVNDAVAANIPLFFALHLPVFFGFRIQDNYSAARPYLDLQEGNFTNENPKHQFYLSEKAAFVASQVLRMQQIDELSQLKLHGDFRRGMLVELENYYRFHVQDFGTLKTLRILTEILS